MESSLSTQILGCCFWATGYLKREAISQCSDRTHVARFPPWDPILFEYDVALCVLWCGNMAVQIQSLVGQYTFTGMADMYMHTVTKLQYAIFTRTHFPTTEFQKKKIQSAPREMTNIYVHSSRIRNKKDWTSLQFQVEKDSKELCAPPPLNHLDIKQNLYHVRVFVMTEVICGK